MVKITAAQVNELRKKTGAGMMDCKKALVEAEGNIEEAIGILRKKGQKIAEKRADRDSSEGAVVSQINDAKTRGVVVSLNCETDFVAKNDTYSAMAKEMAGIAINYDTKEAFLAAAFNSEMTVAEKLIEQTGVIGEKLEIGGFEILEAPLLAPISTERKLALLLVYLKIVTALQRLVKVFQCK
jgi:elongation factor Ts